MNLRAKYPMDLPAEVAAANVKRPMKKAGRDGKPDGEMSEVAVSADEVLSCRVIGAALVVVTTDGQKLFGSAPKGKSGAKVDEVKP